MLFSKQSSSQAVKQSSSQAVKQSSSQAVKQSSSQAVKRRLGFTLSELLVSLAVLGLIAGLTVPSVVQSVEKSKRKAVLKETIQAMSEIIQGGYLNGDFSAITDWTLDSPTDPLVQYVTTRLGGIAKQCLQGNFAPPCNIRHGPVAAANNYTNHSARWVFSNGTTLLLLNGFITSDQILFTINTNPQVNDGIGKQMAVVCNIADAPAVLGNPARIAMPSNIALKPAQCGPYWPPTQSSVHYDLTWEMLYN
jgi:prepilin-type N-terminal cleavage/methylation domain-containing protein